ncbi:hypothetical protein AA0474_0007 [Acetobacter lovaniensis NRIC 0474]|nr:hypothetical protein AA0474_0007 [Acetobacter lovaniensis NRIC 0474]
MFGPGVLLPSANDIQGRLPIFTCITDKLVIFRLRIKWHGFCANRDESVCHRAHMRSYEE